MFDDAATTQPSNDAGVTAEPAPGGVLGPAADATAVPAAAPADPAQPSEPQFNTTPQSVANEPVVAPPASEPAAPADPLPASDPTPTAAPAPSAGGSSDLISLKQQALQSLSPLLAHLDQSPEEKFKTTMMMIQASDDQSLVQTAYDAAQSITDEKEKAQALLDIVNEINYFTQQGTGA